jgi:hypothetical protein
VPSGVATQMLSFSQILQDSLKPRGVTLNIKNVESSVWVDVVINKNRIARSVGKRRSDCPVVAGYVGSSFPQAGGWTTITPPSRVTSGPCS